MECQIHIIKSAQGWAAKSSDATIETLVGENKNMVVRRAEELARQIFGHAILFIHGLDGRILEKRAI